MLNLYLNRDALKDVPVVVDLDATKLPLPWNALDCRLLQSHEDEVFNKDLPILRAYGLLQHGTNNNNVSGLLHSFAHMDSLLNFPHHTYIYESWGTS